MPEQAAFALRGRNPDVLNCIANLSNDEVFTPPQLASRMLDTLAEAWASKSDGASIWSDSSVRFLDPCTKSGVFLREITSRLVEGLAVEMPGLQQRVDHILTKQVFGIALTHITALLARRSVYCSKLAKGKHSVSKSFASDDGNIWFERIEHTWSEGKCPYCGANQRDYDRGKDLETHAYALLHNDNAAGHIEEIFGENMQFDVIVGNPPYQLGQSGGEAIGNFAMPIYQRFVEAAQSLHPRHLVMITPSRWFAGGRGLEQFRREMLADTHIRELVDYPDSRDVFPGVDIAGGVSYFSWDSSYDGPCRVTTVSGKDTIPSMTRYLNDYDVLVRYNQAIPILHKVLATAEGQEFTSLAAQVSPIQPFSIRTNIRGAETADVLDDPVVLYQRGGIGYIERNAVPRNGEWIDQWKVYISATASEHGGQTDKQGMRKVLSKVLVGEPGSACTETFLVVGPFSTKKEAKSMCTFLRTKFVRFLVSLRTNTQHLYSERFSFVPALPMNQEHSDAALYKQYDLTLEEIEFIEKTIRPMVDNNAQDD